VACIDCEPSASFGQTTSAAHAGAVTAHPFNSATISRNDSRPSCDADKRKTVRFLQEQGAVEFVGQSR
jgi:hypothetical protein